METAPRIYTCYQTASERMYCAAVSFEYSYIWGIRPSVCFSGFLEKSWTNTFKSVFYPTSRDQRWGRYKQRYDRLRAVHIQIRLYTDLISSLITWLLKHVLKIRRPKWTHFTSNIVVFINYWPKACLHAPITRVKSRTRKLRLESNHWLDSNHWLES